MSKILERHAKTARAHHDKAEQYADRAEQHAVSCGLMILEAYAEIERQKAELPKGEKKSIMGKGEWLQLAGISSQRSAEYRAIASGDLSMKQLRDRNAEKEARTRAAARSVQTSRHAGENGSPPKALQPDTREVVEPDSWSYPSGCAGTVSLFVSAIEDDDPSDVWPHLKGAVSEVELKAGILFLEELIELFRKEEG